MRIARKLLLLSVIALAALAFGATGAAATDVEITNEATGNHCDVELGNCEVHIVGRTEVTTHLMGVESYFSICDPDEFLATLNENGSGWIHSYEVDSGIGCRLEACNGVGEDEEETEWVISAMDEEAPGGQFKFDVLFCVDQKSNPNGTGRHCVVDIHGVAGGGHSYIFYANDVVCPGTPTVEFDGLWNTEATPHNEGSEHEENIEVIHL